MCGTVFANPKAPRPVEGSAETAHVKEWMQEAVEECSSNSHYALSVNYLFQRWMSHFNLLPYSAIKKNPSFEADLQQMRWLYAKHLYYYGKAQMDQGTDLSHTILNEMKELEAGEELKIPFYKSLKRWDDYYRAWRMTLERMEAKPDRLEVIPEIPPEFVTDGVSAEALLDQLAIIDLCLGLHWRPTDSELENILIRLAKALESKERYSFAVAALQMIPRHTGKREIQSEIARLRKLKDSGRSSHRGGSLY